MDEPLTNELLGELLSAPDPRAYLEKHETPTRVLSDYLQQLLAEKGMIQSKVVHDARLNRTYGYEIFSGAKENPARDKMIAIALAMELTLTEANRVLQAAGKNGLYCKNRRDVIIIYALEHGYTLQRANEALYEFGEAIIE